MSKAVPEGWEKVKLSDIAEVGTGNSAPQGEKYFIKGIYPFVRTQDVGRERNQRFLSQTTDSINEIAIKEYNLNLWPEKTVLFPKSGASTFLNHRVMLKSPAFVSSHLATIVTNTEKAIPEFLYYYLCTIDAKKLVPNNGYPSLRIKDLADIIIILPSLPEQQKIATVLSSVDTAIEKTKAVIEQTKVVKKGLMQELFTKGIPGRHKRFKKTPIGEIPEEWEVVELGDIFELKSGTTPFRKNLAYYKDGKIPWVKTLDLNDSIIVNTEEKITQKAIDEISCSILPKGTVLIAMYGGFNQIGRTGILAIQATTNQAITSLLPNSRTYPKFINFALIFLRNNWENFASSSRKDPNITKNDIRRFKIPFPTLEEQKEIANIIDIITERINKEVIFNRELEYLKSALMQVLLTPQS